MSVIIGYRQTPFRNGANGTYLTPDGMLKKKHTHTSESIYARPPNRNFADFNDRTLFAMHFLLTALTLESDCKNTNIILIDKIFNGNYSLH